MGNENERNLDNMEPQQTPPSVPEQFKTESEWAERLGVPFDAETAANTPKPDEIAEGSIPPPVPGQHAPVPEMPPMLPEREPMPPTYMVWAILATLCCCLPAGVVAIVFSSQVSSKYYMRDYEGARRSSRNAEIWIIVSIVAGIIFNALYMPLSLLIPS